MARLSLTAALVAVACALVAANPIDDSRAAREAELKEICGIPSVSALASTDPTYKQHVLEAGVWFQQRLSKAGFARSDMCVRGGGNRQCHRARP